MYKKILVPLDCSPVDDVVIEHIMKLAKAHQSRVILLRAEEDHPYGLHHNGVAKSKDYLDSAKRRFDAASVPCEVVLAKGDPVQSILTNAETLGCDLIAMATHGHGAFMDFLLGSVSSAVRHATPIPVLLIRQP